MTELPCRVRLLSIFTTHLVGFETTRDLEEALRLEDPLTDQQAAAIKEACEKGEPLFMGFDPYQEQINCRKVPIFSDTEEGVRRRQEDEGRHI